MSVAGVHPHSTALTARSRDDNFYFPFIRNNCPAQLRIAAITTIPNTNPTH